MGSEKPLAEVQSTPAVEVLPGITRRTLAYNPQVMLCHFTLNAGAEMPQHHHEAAQVGYVIKGTLRFKSGDTSFVAGAGSSYSFGPEQEHGATATEDTEVIECFAPSRSEYEG